MPVESGKSIRERLQRIVAGTTITVLAVAGCGIVVFEWASNRQAALHTWSPAAEILADNSAPALGFHDATAAKKTLSALRFQPGVLGAWLYLPDGQLLSDYQRPGEKTLPVAPVPSNNVCWLTGREVLLSCQVRLRGEPVGWLTMRADLHTELAQLRFSTLLLLGCLVVAGIVALTIAYRLQRALLNPIHSLARVADDVARRHDYSMRVAGTLPDEIGRLINAFNDMLGQIEQRDAQLAETRAALTSAEEKYRQLVERVPAVTYTAEFGPVGRWHFVSPQIEKLLGFTPAEWLAEPGQWFQQVHPDDRARALVSEDCTQATGRYVLEYRMLTRAGRMIWVRDEGVVLREPGQSTLLLHGLLRDVTDRQQTTAALDEMRQRFEDIFNSSQDAISFADVDGRLAHSNPAFERLTGYTRDELQMQPIEALTPPEFHELDQQKIRQVLQTGQAVRYEKEGLHKNGTRFPVAVTRFVVRNAAGQITGLGTIARDMTEVHRLQREILEICEREHRRIGQDLHDGVCQMLTATTFAIGALEQQLAAGNLPAARDAHEIGELLRRANIDTRNLAHGMYPIELPAGGLPAALQHLVDDTAQAGKIQCQLDCAADLPAVTTERAVHVYRIAQEVVTNALRHADATQLRVTLARTDGQLRLQIVDDGDGVPAEPPAGLGLNIMAYRARMLNGWLKIRRGTDGGTIVELTFPAG